MEKPNEKPEASHAVNFSSVIFKINILKTLVGKKIVAKVRSGASYEGIVESVTGNVLIIHASGGFNVYIDVNILDVWTS